ncbi:Type-1B angiotensin II receptor [Holothuria leucospilota]|uniref:Type-1B angiotensin II receptor n=1 Tax=Holothuria leucospilota TaxID=206669 RepID=A0A9Q1HBN6_HOLLE|nr:Type-1B angiotensin II receptor [Holothuria leucospilota]
MSETRFLYTWVVIIYRSIVTLTGIPGNLLIIAVYWNKNALGSAQVFIITLALCDLCSCLIIPLEIHYWLNELNYTNTLLCKLFFTWEVTGWFFSACLTATIAWDRYLAVFQPVKGRLTHSKAVKACVMCALVAILANTGIPFTSHVATNVTIAGTDIVNATRCEQYSNDLVLFLLVCIPQYLCFIILFVITILLYTKLWIKMKKRHRPTGDSVLTAPCNQVAVTEPMPERKGDTEGRMTKYNGNLENQINNPSSSGRAGEIPETIRKHLNPEGKHNMALICTSIPGAINEEGMSTTSSCRRVEASNPNDTDKREMKHKSVCLTLNRSHGSRRRQVDPSDSDRSRPMSRLTQMLLLSTVVFVCAWSLSIFTYVLHPITKKLSRRSLAFTVIAVLRLTGLMNHSINPVVYSFMNPKFREECKLLFKRLRRRLSY